MPKNFYNLPPSWNPGYAIPPSVMDEGLERRAFVTAELPRGTYDNPRVGNGGYAVPQYVDEEGYGRGAFTTSWLPRGFTGGNVPHYLDQQFARITGQASLGRGKGVVMAMSTPMGDTTAPYSSSGANLGVFGSFGKRAAAAMIASARRLPPARRSAGLKAMMDKIDPTLYGRAGRLAATASSQGASPSAALAHGLAAAMTEGMLTELHKVGKSRTAPQPRSLLGLGCYGCAAALGAITINVKPDGTKFNMPVTCSGYSWTGSAWAVTRAGAADVPGPYGTTCPASVTHAGGDSEFVTQMNPTGPGADFTAAPKITDHTMLQVGPFSMLALAQRVTFHSFNAEQTQFIKDNVAQASRAGSGYSTTSIMSGTVPIVKFTFPKSDSPNSGKLFGLFYKSGTTPELSWKEYKPDSGILGAIWNGIKEVAAFLYDVVKDAVEFVGDLACSAVSAPGAAGAAAAASGGAAAVGVAIAGGLCGGQTQTPPPPPPAQSSIALPLAILGGGALLIVALNKKKKKASSP